MCFPMDHYAEHDRAVRIIASKVEKFFERKQSFHVYHGTTNCTRQTAFDRDKVVDTSKLSSVIAVDVESRVVTVEPNVSMESLVQVTLASGMLPKVVMEFPSITVGGGFSGTSGESSSFRYGLFEQTVDWIEMVLADGAIVTASVTEKADLFYGAASTFGSLGVVTLLRIQLIPAEPFVELMYYPVRSKSEALEKIRTEMDRPENSYVDAIVFERNHGVIMSGRFAGKIPAKYRPQRYRRPEDPWFYMEAKRNARSDIVQTTFIPIVDYLFRYDRGSFWGGHYALKYLMIPNRRITRFALDRFLRAQPLYHMMHKGRIAEHYIIQDFALPWGNAEVFLQYIDRDFGLYPLWLCPLKNLHKESATFVSTAFLKMGADAEIMLNIGIWGPSSPDENRFREVNRCLETRLSELGGQKALYARAYYTTQEFWNIYDKEWYEELRSQYNATSLASVYEKVTRGNGGSDEMIKERSKSLKARLISHAWKTRPLPGLYGLWKASMGGEYLLGHSRSPKSVGDNVSG